MAAEDPTTPFDDKEPPERPRTLLVRHLPSTLSLADREDLLRFFGAKAVRCMSDSGAMKYSAFVVFDTADQATHALQELHQLDVLGSKLSVQFSNRQFLHDAPVKLPKPPNENEKKTQAKVEELEPIVPDNIDHLASYHKVEYPINPKLMYSYPPPTMEILTNIANALASVPKFYVQVLHLMNKMNLPAPFGPVTQCPPIPSGIPEAPIQELNMQVSSSEESELESDQEGKKEKPTLGQKRMRTDPKPSSVKRPKLQKIISAPKTGKAMKRHEVFEKPAVETEKTKLKETKETVTKLVGVGPDDVDVRKFITLQELEKHRLSARRMKRTPLFKDYEPGVPNSSLIVSNLHKDVPEATITFVFGRYVNWENETEKDSYSVKLDRESKSCIVSFPSEDVAELALQETNGYKLMGEYMMVKFLPKPKVKPEEVSEPAEAIEKSPPEVPEAVSAESVSAIEAAFSAGAESTPPRGLRGTTPENTGGETPERSEIKEMANSTSEVTPRISDKFESVNVQTAEQNTEIQEKLDKNDEKNEEHETMEAEEPLVDYEDSRYVSKSELEKGRISEDKMANFKVFNNYNPGEVSNRLYIKNLNPKQIQESEFIWLFGGFLNDKEKEASEQMDIKIMKEGRMKGQAFVTFPSSTEAEKALKATNGFVLHGKPMVVVFGKQS